MPAIQAGGCAAQSGQPTIAAANRRERGGSDGRHGLANPGFQRQHYREIDAAFAALASERPDALFISGGPFFAEPRASSWLTSRPGMRFPRDSYRAIPEVGGLMSYGASLTEAHRQAGIYVGRILKGAKPADLPVEQSTKFELVINLKTAKTLGLNVPPTLLASPTR